LFKKRRTQPTRPGAAAALVRHGRRSGRDASPRRWKIWWPLATASPAGEPARPKPSWPADYASEPNVAQFHSIRERFVTDAAASRLARRLAKKSVPSIESTWSPGNNRTSREMSPPGVWTSTGTEIA